MRADQKGGSLTTEPIVFDGDYLFVNVAVPSKKGTLTVEVLDKDGNPIEGFSGKQAIALKKTDSTKARVEWKENKTLAALKGQPVRLRFNLTDGDLYSFWISPWETGESRGYTAGGGPGLSETGIDQPSK